MDLSTLWLVPVVAGVTQAVKATLVTKRAMRFVPLIALALGLAGGLAFVSLDTAGALTGIVSGLTAVGLYEAGKGIVAG